MRLAVRLFTDCRIDRLGIDRRAIDAEAFAESAHPQVVLIELLTAGQRAPRDQLVHVGIACIVADGFGFNARPGWRGDDLARLRNNIAIADLLVFLGNGQMRMVATCELRQRFPCLDRHLTVGFRRERQNDLGCVDVGIDARTSFACARLLNLAVQIAEQLDLVFGIPRNALAAIAQLVEKRPNGRIALVEVWIIALHNHDRWHGLAGDRLDFALLPVKNILRLRQFARRVMQGRHKNDVLLDTQHFRRHFRELLRDTLEDFPVAACFPCRIGCA